MSVSPREIRKAVGGALVWARRIGTPSGVAAHSTAVDASGNILLVGRHGGRLDLRGVGGPPLKGRLGEAFVVALGPGGELHWFDRLAGAGGPHRPWTAAPDADGGYCLAGPSGEGTIVLKLEPEGRRAWVRPVSEMVSHARDGQPLALAVDPAGNILVSGHGSMLEGGSALAYLFALKLNGRGDLLWQRRFLCAAQARKPRVAVDAQGEALLAGYFQGWVDFAGDVLESAAGWNMYLAKLDASGKCLWTRHPRGEGSSDLAAGMDADGNVLLGGVLDGTIDLGGGIDVAGDMHRDEGPATLLATLTRAGTPRSAWRRPCPDVGREVSFAPAEDGAVLLAGCARSSEPFVLKAHPDDGVAWTCSARGPTHEVKGLTVRALPDGGAVLTASFRGKVDFGGGPLVNDRQHLDMFVVRLSGGPPDRPLAGAGGS